MKYPKFKLINNFPNRKLGDVALYNPDNCIDNYVWEADGKIIPKEFQPDVTPNWFEMIAEKNYEILSMLLYNNMGKPCHIIVNGVSQLTLDNPENYTIHSVKRLSDGEIFTVGDDISATDNVFTSGNRISTENSGKWLPQFYKTKVKEFKIIKERLCIIFNDYQDKNNTHGQPIEFIKKLKRVLTTEDYIDVFKGDSYSFIWIKNPAHGQVVNKVYKIGKARYEKDAIPSVDAKFFTSEEKAQEWLNSNTPLFTTEDGKEIFEGDSWWYVVLNKPMMYPRQTNTLVYRGTNTSEVKRFSTEEAANCFILNNREPNFITEDGVKIYPRMKYYAINTKTFNEPREVICEVGTSLGKQIKSFSTQALADKYFLMNAPRFSLRDIGKIYSTAGDFKKNPNGEYNKYIRGLIRIFNSKIE